MSTASRWRKSSHGYGIKETVKAGRSSPREVLEALEYGDIPELSKAVIRWLNGPGVAAYELAKAKEGEANVGVQGGSRKGGRRNRGRDRR
jgi:hypothetical protein